MADAENSPPEGEGKSLLDVKAESKRAVFDLAILIDSLAHGLEALAKKPAAALVVEELGVLAKYVKDAQADIDELVRLVNGPRPMA